MVVISSMYFVMFLMCSLLLASQRPARGDDQHAAMKSGSLDCPMVARTYVACTRAYAGWSSKPD